MKIDIPFLSSIWALGSSDTHWTSSEQSIIHNEASPVNCTGMRAATSYLIKATGQKERLRITVKSAGIHKPLPDLNVTIKSFIVLSKQQHIRISSFLSTWYSLNCSVDNSGAIICTGSARTTEVSENARFYFESKITELPVVSWQFQSESQLLLWWVHKSATHLCWSKLSVIQMQMCLILYDTLISWCIILDTLTLIDHWKCVRTESRTMISSYLQQSQMSSTNKNVIACVLTFC